MLIHIALKEVLEIKDTLNDALECEEKTGRFYLNPFVCIERRELATITNLEVSQIQSFRKKDILKNINDGKKRFEFDERNYPKYHFLAEKIKCYDDAFE